MKKIIMTIVLACSANIMWAGNDEHKEWSSWNKFLHNYTYYARIGYNIGGTAPIGMPASIRTLHSYSLRPNFTLGIDAYHPISKRWGYIGGIRFENKGMKTDAGVKAYHMKIVRGGDALEGTFTGSVVTKVDMSMITVPITATYDASSNLRIKLGPYVSYVTAKKFEGWAYDGYLRRQEEGMEKGDPTGQKVILGNQPNERGDYDFADDMRNWQFGVDLGADWYITKRWGVSADLKWGLNGIFKKDFTVIEQTMYPIYGTIGISYQLK